MANSTTDGKLQSGNPFFVTIARQALSFYLEKNGLFFPPAVFETESDFEWWVDSEGFSVKKLAGYDLSNVRVIVSPKSTQYPYEALWVKAGFGGYRNAMKSYARMNLSTGETEKSIKQLDPDHIVNRENLKKTFNVHWKNTWVWLFPVVAGMNRSFGSSIEKSLISYHVSDSIDLSPIHLMKIFGVVPPSTLSELKTTMAEIERQLFCNTPSRKIKILNSIESDYRTLRKIVA